jgi:hypothetical protein
MASEVVECFSFGLLADSFDDGDFRVFGLAGYCRWAGFLGVAERDRWHKYWLFVR